MGVDAGFFVFIAIVGAVLVLFLMSAFGPQDRETGFWAGLKKFRVWLDAFSYYAISAAVVFCIVLGIVLMIKNR